MYIFSMDYTNKGVLGEQLGFDSLHKLPVLNNNLLELQLINFVGLPVKTVYVISSEDDLVGSLFDLLLVNENELFRALFELNDNEDFFVFKNDVYFELEGLELYSNSFTDINCIEDENGEAFAFFGKIRDLKKILNMNISILDFFNKLQKNSLYKSVDGCIYSKHLDNLKSYKELLFDILNGRTLYNPPFVAEGVYVKGNIPRGDFSIISPVYIGEAVQIEGGSVIGPNTIIHDNTLISKNTSIKNTLLLENVYVSSDCYIDGAICCENSTIRRNSAVFSGTIIGSGALIGEEMTLESDSVINKNTRCDRLSLLANKEKKLSFIDNKFRDIAPDKAVLLGYALGSAFKKPKVIVGSDGSNNALILKLGFLSGLIASGCECFEVGVTFKAGMFFMLDFCECDYFVFFSSFGEERYIDIYNSRKSPISKAQCYNLLSSCYNGELVLSKNSECKTIRQIRGLRKMYTHELSAFSDSDLPFVSEINCNNQIILNILQDLLEICTVKQNSGDEIKVFVNESATNANIRYNGKNFTHRQLEKLAYHYENKPDKIKAFESDLYKKLWRYDAVILIMAVLNIIKNEEKPLDALVNELPMFYIKSDSISLDSADSKLAQNISKRFKFKHQKDGFNLKLKDGYIRLINNKNKGEVKVMVAAKNMEASEEICGFFKGYFSNL